MNTTIHYALHIDDLRISKGLTVNQLCESICDDSTYRRYKNGKKDIPIYKLNQFCEKLNLSLDEFISNTMSKKSIEYQKVYNLYAAKEKKDWKTIKDFISKTQHINFFYRSNEILYNYIVSTYEYNMNFISKSKYLNDLLNLLPEKFDLVSFNDVIVLEKVAEIEVSQNHMKHLNILNNLLLNPKKLYLIKNNEHVISNLYSNISILYSRLNQFSESYALAEKGISYSLKHHQFKAIPNLYYLLAYNLFKQDKIRDASKELYYLIAYVYSTKQKDKIDYFLELIKKEFNQNIYDKIEDYLKNLIV